MKKEESVKDNKFGFASFILGLFSLLFFWLIIPSIIMGLVGIIFAIIQLRKGKSKFAIAGLILCLISLFAAIYLIIKIVSIVQGAYACQTDITSEGCTKFAAAFGLDAETLKCTLNPNAAGCETFSGSQGNST